MERHEEGVPLIERNNIFEGVDSGIKQHKSIADKLHLPKLNRQKEEIKYGPNRAIYFNDKAANAAVR